MIVNVHMADCRTVFQLASRADLRVALKRDLADDGAEQQRVVQGFVKWQPDDPSWMRLRVVKIRQGSIMFVVNAEDVAQSHADLPARELLNERTAKWLERQRALAAEATT